MDEQTPNRGIKRTGSEISPPSNMPLEKVQVQEDMPSWAKLLLNGQNNIIETINGLKTSVDFSCTQSQAANTATEALQGEVNQLKSENQALKSKINKLEQWCAMLEQRLDGCENYSRKPNLLISGVNEDDTENCNAVAKKFFADKLDVAVEDQDIGTAHRVGTKSSDAQKSRPLLVRFNNMNKRQSVMTNAFKLKNTKLSVNQDYCQNTLAARRKLLSIYNHCKRHPQYKIGLKLNGDRLIIKGKAYTVANLDSLPDDLNPAKLATPTENGVTLFFTENSPLSNFYKCKFSIGGQEYCCVEQYLWARKAIVYGDEQSLYRIMNTDSQVMMKRVGHGIKPKDDGKVWLEMMPEVMTQGVHAKFTQNDNLKQFLAETGETILAEANPRDTKWGCGFGMFHTDAFNTNKWQGLNELGKIMMQVRDDL